MQVKGDGMFAGNYFSYGGINSEKYELAILIVDEEQNKKIGGELDYTSFYNRYNDKTQVFSLYRNPTILSEKSFSIQYN